MSRSDNVTPLKIADPNADAQAHIIELLQESIERVKKEGATDVIILLGWPGREWQEIASPSISHIDWVGKVQTLMFSRQMQHYINQVVEDESDYGA